MHQAEGKITSLSEDHIKAIFESNNVYLNLFQKGFNDFVNFKKEKRYNLIKQNKLLKDLLNKSNILSKENSTNFNNQLIKINKINEIKFEQVQQGVCVINNNNDKKSNNINLEDNFSIKIPKGIFYYPIDRIVRADDIHIVYFIPYFSNFKKFEKVIEKTNTYLDDWFDEIPHNLDKDETLINPEFLIWIFIKGLQILKVQVNSFDQSFFVEILTIYSNIIEKNSSIVFKKFQTFFKKIIDNKKRNLTISQTNINDYPFELISGNNKISIDDKFNENSKEINGTINSNIEKKQIFTEKIINFLFKYIYKREFHQVHDELIIESNQDKSIDENIISHIYNENNQNTKNNNIDRNYEKNLDFSNFESKYFDKNFDRKSIELLNCRKKIKDPIKIKLNFFREAYCQICFIYYCPYHFKREYKFYDYEFNNISLHKRYLKRYITDIKQREGLESLDLNNIFTDKNQKKQEIQKGINDDLNLNLNLNEDDIYKLSQTKDVTNPNPNNIKTELINISDMSLIKKEAILDLSRNQNTITKHPFFISRKSKKNQVAKGNQNSTNLNDNSIDKKLSERERKNITNSTNNYYDSASPKKQSSSLRNLNRAKQVIQAYKLNVNNYTPCQAHEGACNSENCLCIKNRNACEKFCFCSGRCKNEFPGCFCVNGCNASCSCAINMRECDPDICRCCNIQNEKNIKYNLEDVCLDLFNCETKKNKKELFFDCGNCDIFLGKRKKTCVSNSLVAENYGLFAYEDIEKDEYICEYIGELLSREETDRRSVFNDQLGLNYFFKLNENHDIDAYSIGNEMRFVNHSSFGYDNCYARTKYVRGIYRIGLFALRKISKGEELFFDYKINWNVPWMNKYKSLFS